jgi:hypothetical protein
MYIYVSFNEAVSSLTRMSLNVEMIRELIKKDLERNSLRYNPSNFPVGLGPPVKHSGQYSWAQ